MKKIDNLEIKRKQLVKEYQKLKCKKALYYSTLLGIEGLVSLGISTGIFTLLGGNPLTKKYDAAYVTEYMDSMGNHSFDVEKTQIGLFEDKDKISLDVKIYDDWIKNGDTYTRKVAEYYNKEANDFIENRDITAISKEQLVDNSFILYQNFEEQAFNLNDLDSLSFSVEKKYFAKNDNKKIQAEEDDILPLIAFLQITLAVQLFIYMGVERTKEDLTINYDKKLIIDKINYELEKYQDELKLLKR